MTRYQIVIKAIQYETPPFQFAWSASTPSLALPCAFHGLATVLA